MKDKFSIFSSPQNRTEPNQASINFVKSPKKYAVYDQSNRIKDSVKPSTFHAVSANNLDNLKKLSNESSALRQTLNNKTSDFGGWNEQAEKDRVYKPTNILRQTLNIKPVFKSKIDKKVSQSFSGHQVQSNYEPYSKNDSSGLLGYSQKPDSNLGQSKSWHYIYNSKDQQRTTRNQQLKIDQKRQKQSWKSNDYYRPVESGKHQKILQQLQHLKKLSSYNSELNNQSQRKYNSNTVKKESEQHVFRKNREGPSAQCYTPKLPKYSYDDRFKKVPSPTSTQNSSPPNQYGDTGKNKGRAMKLGLDQFIIGKTLGQGKFGTVYMAKHKRLGTLVALKKIPKEMIKSHLMIEQLSLEIRLQSCLNHKNVLGMYGFFDDKTHLFIVLEYMEQGTLYAQLKKNKILNEKQAGIIVKQMTEAIEYLHDLDIAHRDIKPENIVISNNVSKLCDFGWATFCNERRKTYCGTFDYAAPQILEGSEYDMSVDLWCLGVMTFELLTGKAPFYHISRKQTVKKILNVETQAITYPQSMSHHAVDFIQKLVRKNPDERMKAHDALKHPFLLKLETN